MDSRDENAGGITEVASDQLPVTDSPFKRRKKSMVTLRELGTSDRYFWRDSLAEQLSQTVGDKGSDGNIRRLPGNEVTVMTLNEIAVRRGRGFFFHLRERRGWRSHSNEELNPQSRDPPPPGAEFPTIVYMNYVWSSHDSANFLCTSHRSRYLMSDALINTPTDNAPLYALQYIEHSKYPTFQTSSDSLIVIATSSSIFMVKASEWKRIVGLRSAKGKGEMFNTTPFLWSRSANNVEEQEIISKMKPFEVKNMEVLYEAITMRCRFRDLAANFAADGLRQTLPGPASPGLGIALGTPLALVGEQQGKVLESSNPPTRRGGRLRRGRAGQALGTMGRGRRSCKETDKKRNEVDNISDGTEERQNE